MAAFSSSGEAAITRTIDVVQEKSTASLSSAEFDDFYEIERTVEDIRQGGYKRVALQFPDELLHDSVPIYTKLKALLGQGRDLYVLADTSYGSCCVDEVAAQHVDADAIIHYGHACLSQTSRLPVIYVFGHKPINVDLCVSSLIKMYSSAHPPSETEEPRIIKLRHDVGYTHQIDSILSQLRTSLERSSITIRYTPIKLTMSPQSKADDDKQPSPEIHAIFYVGGESLSLTNILVTHATSEVFSYDPQQMVQEGINPRIESGKTNKLLMRRYSILQKARDADVFGILVGTLGVASYLPLLSHLRALLKRNQKKSYTISVGKLNPAKLANFMEIECFVLVACPENSLIDAKDFLRPIVTPYELEIALRAEQSWTGRYILNFEQVMQESLASQEGEQPVGDEEEDPDQPVFSLVTGTYRHARRYGKPTESAGAENGGTDAVVLRNQDTAVTRVLEDSAGSRFFQERTFRGLEVHRGEDAPSALEEGRSGIARGYNEAS